MVMTGSSKMYFMLLMISIILRKSAINRAADLIDQVRLSHRMMHIARDLSGGEKQRVVLARQLAKDPFMLFADEPTGTLDPGTAKIVHSMLSEAAKTNNMGMVVTSHFSQVIQDVAAPCNPAGGWRDRKDRDAP